MPQQTFSDQASYADNTAQEILFIVYTKAKVKFICQKT